MIVYIENLTESTKKKKKKPSETKSEISKIMGYTVNTDTNFCILTMYN